MNAFFEKFFCLWLFFSILLFVEGAWALSLGDKLALLGYSEDEIAEVLSGRTSLKTLRTKFRMEIIGYDASKPSPIRSVLSLFPNPQPDASRPWDKRLTPYFNIIKDAAERTRLKQSLLMAVIKVESDFNPNALSPKGAIGLMQIMPETARELGLIDPFDPLQNIHGGARYLSDCIHRFDNLGLGLAAYNAGPNLVAKLKRIPSIEETQNYVDNVMKYIKIYDRLSPSN